MNKRKAASSVEGAAFLLRLEVEEENARAVHVYKKSGFEFFEYKEMKKE